jgi:hypothetical protein
MIMKLIQDGTHHLHIPRGKQRLLHEYHLQKGCGLLLFIARTTFIMLKLKLWDLPTMMKQFITMIGELNNAR